MTDETASDRLVSHYEGLRKALETAIELIESAERETDWRSAPWHEPSATVELLAALASQSPPPTDDDLIQRLNTFTTCGCGDDDWPLLRHDVVERLDALSAQLPPPINDAQARKLIHESLYHLRLDDGAKGYHDRALAFLREQSPPPIRGEVLLRRFLATITDNGRCRDTTLNINHADLKALRDDAEKFLATPSSPEGWVLPCDVRLPPATVIKKGCKLSTLIDAMNYRAEAGVTEFASSPSSTENKS